MKILSAKQYAKEVGVTDGYISKILKKSSALPFASEVEKYGNTWRITVPTHFDITEARNLLKTLA